MRVPLYPLRHTASAEAVGEEDQVAEAVSRDRNLAGKERPRPRLRHHRIDRVSWTVSSRFC